MSPEIIATIIVVFAVVLAFGIVWGIRAHRQKILAGKEDLIGRSAEVTTAIAPRGTVFVEGESWTAISESGRIEPGEEVVITRVDGLKLWVTKKR